MEELELAIEYLKERAISTVNVNDKLMKQLVFVLPLYEVENVLEMVKSGEFTNYYNKVNDIETACVEPDIFNPHIWDTTPAVAITIKEIVAEINKLHEKINRHKVSDKRFKDILVEKGIPFLVKELHGLS